jgi:hypothetical protein
MSRRTDRMWKAAARVTALPIKVAEPTPTYSARTLKDELPREFFAEFMTTNAQYDPAFPQGKPSPAALLLDVQVVREYSRVTDEAGYKPWPGPQKDVHCWWELENGKAVGWNENPSKGWSFPVITLHKLEIWNGRGDYADLNGHLWVCAETRGKAVELLKQAGHRHINLHELDGYFNRGCWGNPMFGIKREAGVWFVSKENEHESCECQPNLICTTPHKADCPRKPRRLV